MRDFSGRRSGFDGMLAAVAASFLLVTTSAAWAQSNPATPAEQSITAAVPVPEPANVPPPSASDIKPGTATVAAPAAATPPAATAAVPAVEAPKVAANAPGADQVRDIFATKATKYFDRKNERAAADAFYKDRSYAPMWTENGALTARAKGVIAKLKDAASDGLNPNDYPTPDFAAASSPDAQADAELKLTASVLDYARQAQSGRMHWSQVTGDILYPDHPTDPTEVLVNVSTAKDASVALAGYNPPHKGYQALKAELAKLRGETEGPVTAIAEGETLKLVKPKKKTETAVLMEDPRVPAIRGKLGITENADDQRYDEKVADAVRKFQDKNDLKPTGILDNQTIRALNGPKRDKQIDVVRVNMERWRWLPRELGAAALGNAYVILNIPDFTLKVMQNGAQVWTTRVVTGKPGTHATPLLTETMKYITVNPTWNVPPSIVYNEYLPAMQQDPTVLQRMGLKFERNRDGSVHISQPPGEGNALGRIRFNFPNKFLVYQHDTPDKHLFAKEERAFSHGCMRVQNPDQYAATLLGIVLPKENYTAEKIRGMYGRGEVNINFPTPLPVNITYQTAFVDDAGQLQMRKDIYGRDASMIAMLKGAGTKDLETVVARSQPNYVKPTGNLNIPGDQYASNSGLGFFERLFGAPTPAPTPVRGRRVVR